MNGHHKGIRFDATDELLSLSLIYWYDVIVIFWIRSNCFGVAIFMEIHVRREVSWASMNWYESIGWLIGGSELSGIVVQAIYLNSDMKTKSIVITVKVLRPERLWTYITATSMTLLPKHEHWLYVLNGATTLPISLIRRARWARRQS